MFDVIVRPSHMRLRLVALCVLNVRCDHRLAQYTLYRVFTLCSIRFEAVWIVLLDARAFRSTGSCSRTSARGRARRRSRTACPSTRSAWMCSRSCSSTTSAWRTRTWSSRSRRFATSSGSPSASRRSTALKLRTTSPYLTEVDTEAPHHIASNFNFANCPPLNSLLSFTFTRRFVFMSRSDNSTSLHSADTLRTTLQYPYP